MATEVRQNACQRRVRVLEWDPEVPACRDWEPTHIRRTRRDSLRSALRLVRRVRVHYHMHK